MFPSNPHSSSAPKKTKGKASRRQRSALALGGRLQKGYVYLRKNSKPVFADEQIQFGEEKDESHGSRAILQFPQGGSAQYITWAQAVENLKFYVTELRQSFFTQLQLPDWSYESMKSTPMSGESRKQLFIDSQLKVKDESGRLLEFFDREVNVVKALGFTLRFSRSA